MSSPEQATGAELPSTVSGPVLERDAVGGPSAAAPGDILAGKSHSLFSDAWRDLRRRPIFWMAVVLVVVFITMAIWPQLFTSADPQLCKLSQQHLAPSAQAYFGYDFQGCDVYARTIYGARASVQVGFLSLLLATILAFSFGLTAGYLGGWVDSLLTRIIDIVLGVPYLLAAVVLARRLTAGREGDQGTVAVVLVIGALGWTTAARVIRSSVITAKEQDYVAAARMLGATGWRIIWRHILPNSLAPVVVVLTISLGAFIASEATLSFLGVGLQGDSISWGIDIAAATVHAREAVIPLLAPATFLALTVLAFIMLGDAIRDAFDPKLR